jgi:alkanesulfonate monooxygenase
MREGRDHTLTSGQKMRIIAQMLTQHSLAPQLQLFSTCPQSSAVEPENYLQKVIDTARWSEAAGCQGILVYTDNSLVDAWLVAQTIVSHTTALCPLVAVQPVYMHPYTVAKIISSFGFLYGRRVCLNLVAGGFKNDLLALNDTTPHDQRYARLIEYMTIIRRLLVEQSPVTFEGQFYRVEKLRLTPQLAPELLPGVLLSGSSNSGLAAARAIGATAVRYPEPADKHESEASAKQPSGIRAGIICRKTEAEAWAIARTRFPEDRRGQLTHQLAMKVSDSVWHKQLSELGASASQQDSPYWLVPFQNYKTFCPYMVGSYERVARELARYIALGYRSFITDIPPDEEELRHINRAFAQAMAERQGGSATTPMGD